MTETLEITTEQINDLPLLLGLVEEMGIRQAIDVQIRPHGHWQGISVGTVVSIWLCHLLMERDHRLVLFGGEKRPHHGGVKWPHRAGCIRSWGDRLLWGSPATSTSSSL